ncbi:ABC transporter ATP-binding protein [Trueperella bialowiezensis]|uniref:Lipoprotein-releasing system ATP-binding protein LolD n=1 Tax=Trueperella bialowiezensis TaxID=312285 RepID=A0A3S5EW10_9ACTO|nr:ABC transporter ATP-binding protein [Trueperella bialowiezensis]VEI13045.1 Lipoprotein-releasing system ATP-binding protein LolD [Trueperella bialowiezensis]
MTEFEETAVVLEHIRFGYRKRAPLFTDFDMSIPKGKMTAITGPSGCGKSTLLYIIAGLLRPYAGSITVDGVEILNMTDRECSRFRATQTGFVFQDFVLDPNRSILDAVLEPCIYANYDENSFKARARHLLDSFGVLAPETATPLEISGGQAQRVALARAVLLDPSVIFADEPTGNLDKDSAKIVLDVLHDLTTQGTSVIVVTHDDRVAERADHVVGLERVT